MPVCVGAARVVELAVALEKPDEAVGRSDSEAMGELVVPVEEVWSAVCVLEVSEDEVTLSGELDSTVVPEEVDSA